MPTHFAPFDPIDQIADLTRSLTYGEMIGLAAELWEAAGDAEITAKTLPAILHRWASERAQRTDLPASTNAALMRALESPTDPSGGMGDQLTD